MKDVKTLKSRVIPYMKISEMISNDRNPRTITEEDVEVLKTSILESPSFMELRPIILDKFGIIQGGNQRFKACEELGLTEVPFDVYTEERYKKDLQARKELAEKKGKKFGNDTKKLTIAYFENLNDKKKKDFVTNADFAVAAEFFKKWNTNRFEKSLDDIEEELSLPTPLSVLGNVTYPPPGFYTGKRSKCDWKYVAVVKASTKYEIAKNKNKKSNNR